MTFFFRAEVTKGFKQVGHVVPGVVVCLLLCIMVGRVKKAATVIGASCCGALPA